MLHQFHHRQRRSVDHDAPTRFLTHQSASFDPSDLHNNQTATTVEDVLTIVLEELTIATILVQNSTIVPFGLGSVSSFFAYLSSFDAVSNESFGNIKL